MRLWTSSMSALRTTGACWRADIAWAGPGRTGRDVQIGFRVVEEVGGEDGQAQVGECLGKLLAAPAAADRPGPGKVADVPGVRRGLPHHADQRVGLLLAQVLARKKRLNLVPAPAGPQREHRDDGQRVLAA